MSERNSTYDFEILGEQGFPSNPIEKFDEWLNDAKAAQTINYYNAMCLSTAGNDGIPDARIVLLRGVDSAGFRFYTNSLSTKGLQLSSTPFAALTFYWDQLRRQVRIRGTVEALSAEESDKYFAARPRESQISAWASLQSQELRQYSDFEERIARYSAEFESREVPRPKHWYGYIVAPLRIEFWQEREFRRHDRIVYSRENGEWAISRLFP